MTLSQIRARTRFFIDEPTQKNWTDSDLNTAINRAQEVVVQEIQHIYEDYFEQIADLNPSGGGTIAAQELYLLPSDFVKFKRIERTDTQVALKPIDLSEKYAYTNPVSIIAWSGGPSGYYVSGNSLGLVPTPTATVPIRMTYIYQPADLVNDTDVSPIPSAYHDLLAVRAAMDAFIKDEADISQLQFVWEEGMSRLAKTIRNRQVQEPKHVIRTQDGYADFTLYEHL